MLLLIGLSIAFMAMGKYIKPYPVFIFVGISPIFAIYEYLNTDSKNPWAGILTYIVPNTTLVFIIWNVEYNYELLLFWLQALFYGVLISFVFLAYHFTNKHAKNKLGLLTIVIYWLAIEYLALKINPSFARFILANAFNGVPEWVNWNYHTGFLGGSLWILVANILLYYCFFKDMAIFKGKIRWLSLFYSTILISIPLIISMFSTQMAITQRDVLELYSHQAEPNLSSADIYLYKERGEWLGRTAVWVSILLILYGFVKKQVK